MPSHETSLIARVDFWRCSRYATILLLLMTTGCRPTSSQPDPTTSQNTESKQEQFRDVTHESGISFTQVAGGDDYFVPRSIGSGVAIFDANGDNRLDLYLIQNAGPDGAASNQFYLQLPDGSFDDATDAAGLRHSGWGMGAIAGDINNDGLIDLLITEYGGIRCYLNRSSENNVRFVDITEQSGLRNPAWGTSASLFDYDRDGWLDLVVVNYLEYDPSRRCTDASGRQDFCGPQSFPPTVARLFRNLGSNQDAQFEDVTITAGLATSLGAGLGVICSDFDGNQWPDIFVANDGVANTLWMNQGDGTFVEEATQRGVAYNALGQAEADMGIAFGDVNQDGLFDLFVTHRATETHTLWLQGPRGIFADQTATSGIPRTAWRGTGFGTAFADFDNDGDLDLSLVNGRVLRTLGPVEHLANGLPEFWHAYAQQDQLLRNDGQGNFDDISTENPSFSQAAAVSRGLACGDLNNDGSLDFVVTTIAGPTHIFQNTGLNTGNWLNVRAWDPRLKRDAYGARIELRVGDKVYRREINPGYSYLSSNDVRAHFGVAAAQSYDDLVVIWPDGLRESFGSGTTNQFLTVRRGDQGGSN